jgi:hypothetical protein
VSGWADLIHDAMVEMDDAFSALHAARAAGEPTGTLDRIAQEAAARSNTLRDECREAFAKSRGWMFNKKTSAMLDPFSRASNGARFIDHGEFFDSLDQKCVALVTHSLAPAQELADYGERHGWKAELLPFSWQRNPRFTQCVLFTLKVGARWAS